MHPRLYIGLLLFLVSLTSNAQTINWSFTTGSSLNECPNFIISEIVKDKWGNVIYGGSFESSSIDVDPSPAVYTLTNIGAEKDMFIAKYDSLSNIQWAFSLSSNGSCGIKTIAVDTLGDIYATGFFNGTVDFNPSTTGVYNLTALSPGIQSSGDVFIAKYTANGTFLWAHAFGGGTGYDYGDGLAVTNTGTVYVGGLITLTGPVDVDPSAGVFNLLTSGGDAFCVKYDANGQFLNAFNIGATYQNSCIREIVMDHDTTMYIAGYIMGNCDIDPSSGVTMITSNSEDPFLLKMDTNFNLSWGFNINTNGLTDEAFSVSLDANNVYLSGYVRGNNIDFDPSAVNTSLSTVGASDNFIARYSKSGQYKWANTFGGISDDWSFYNRFHNNEVVVSGYFTGSTDFDPSIATHVLTSSGGKDGYVARYDTNGVFKCAMQVGGILDDFVNSTLEYRAGKILMNGTFRNIATIKNINTTIGTITSNGGVDIFLADLRWDTCGGQVITPCTLTSSFNDTVVACKMLAFTGSSVGGKGPVSYNWTFGDGGSAVGITATHTYLTFGTYNVTLYVTDSAGCIDSSSQLINITDVQAGFNISDDTVCVGQPVQLTATATGLPPYTYVWDLGDGTTTTGGVIAHVYNSNGIFLATLTVTDSLGCTDTVVQSITVGSSQAGFTLSDDTLCTGELLQVSANATGQVPYQYSWDLGDGTTLTGSQISYNYSNSGVYNVRLLLTDGWGCSDTVIQTVMVGSIQANFSISDDTVCVGQQIQFMATANGTIPFTCSWNFGDGNTAIGVSTKHAYFSTGVHTITMVANNEIGCADTISRSVLVHNGTSANVEITICPDSNFVFGGQVINKPGTYTHVFSSVDGCDSTVILNISVATSAIIDFTYNLQQINKPIEFTNTSVDAVSYLWDFGDGATANTTHAEHQYSNTGTYLVCLTGWSAAGCKATICKNIFTEVVKVIDVPTAFSPNGDKTNDILFVRGSGVKQMVFRVYNRWGQKIFESSSLSQGWDGTYNGTPVDMETVAYTLQAIFIDDTSVEHQGSIAIIR